MADGECMAEAKDLLGTIEAVHLAGLEEKRWPAALRAVANLVGGDCATLEALTIPDLEHCEFLGFNVPQASELLYLHDYVPLNPRIPFAARRRSGELICDYQFLDEAAIDRDPFYAEFLTQVGMRYFVAAILERSNRRMVTVSVHRSRRHGHIDESGLAVLRRLLPHLRQAHDVTTRLKGALSRANAFQSTLDCLREGVILLRADRSVLHVNDTALAILSRRDGIQIIGGRLEFDSASVRAEFEAALGQISRLHDGVPADPAADIAVPRGTAPAYLVSIRLIARASRASTTAAAIVFIRDPWQPRASPASTLRAALGLTGAEAALAQAIQAGTAPSDYARKQLISLNTVYTHLRRIKEKAGCKRIPELIRKLNDLQPPL